jgi:hypothetical protein
MTGNSFTNNIIISADGGYFTGRGTFPNGNDEILTVKNNAYYNYAGGPVDSGCGYSLVARVHHGYESRHGKSAALGLDLLSRCRQPCFQSARQLPGHRRRLGTAWHVIPHMGTPPSSPH